MKGGIYADQKCAIWSASLKNDDRKKLCCPSHPEQIATNLRDHFGKVKRLFASYPEAQRFLSGLLYKTDENAFDARDYSSNKPLNFMNFANKWLEVKRETIKPSSYRSLHNYIMKVCEARSNSNITDFCGIFNLPRNSVIMQISPILIILLSIFSNNISYSAVSNEQSKITPLGYENKKGSSD